MDTDSTEIITPATNSVYKPLLGEGLRMVSSFGYLGVPR